MTVLKIKDLFGTLVSVALLSSKFCLSCTTIIQNFFLVLFFLNTPLSVCISHSSVPCPTGRFHHDHHWRPLRLGGRDHWSSSSSNDNNATSNNTSRSRTPVWARLRAGLGLRGEIEEERGGSKVHRCSGEGDDGGWVLNVLFKYFLQCFCCRFFKKKVEGYEACCRMGGRISWPHKSRMRKLKRAGVQVNVIIFFFFWEIKEFSWIFQKDEFWNLEEESYLPSEDGEVKKKYISKHNCFVKSTLSVFCQGHVLLQAKLGGLRREAGGRRIDSCFKFVATCVSEKTREKIKGVFPIFSLFPPPLA